MAYDKILITDFETTGLEASWHEIIEIGATLVDMKSLDVIWEHDAKIKPRFIERAQPKALEVNGYNEADWTDAEPFYQGFTRFLNRLDHTMIFTGQNVWFDLQFYLEGLKYVNLKDPLDPTEHGYSYHRLDLTSMVFPFVWPPVFSMSKIAPALGIEPEAKPHRGINGARKELEILREIKRRGDTFQLALQRTWYPPAERLEHVG